MKKYLALLSVSAAMRMMGDPLKPQEGSSTSYPRSGLLYAGACKVGPAIVAAAGEEGTDEAGAFDIIGGIEGGHLNLMYPYSNRKELENTVPAIILSLFLYLPFIKILPASLL